MFDKCKDDISKPQFCQDYFRQNRILIPLAELYISQYASVPGPPCLPCGNMKSLKVERVGVTSSTEKKIWQQIEQKQHEKEELGWRWIAMWLADKQR